MSYAKWLVRRWRFWAEAHSLKTARRTFVVPAVQALEDRLLLAAPPTIPVQILVTKDADITKLGQAAIPGSLREAINKANENPGPAIIRFAVGDGPRLIKVAMPLPKITDTLVIDAATRPENMANQKISLKWEPPKNVVVPEGDGLEFIGPGANNSAVYGLIISEFERDGIRVSNCKYVQIGGPGANQGNTIQLNRKIGIHLTDGAAFNTLYHNTIYKNERSGVCIDQGSNNNVLGSLPATAEIIQSAAPPTSANGTSTA
jgi:parallel beta-helix repeat protein